MSIAPFTFIRPCAPALKRIPPSGPDWIHEIKWDGWRLQAHKEGKEVRLYTRSARDVTKQFPTITEAVRRLPRRDVILDGELIAVDQEGKPSFHLLRSRRPDVTVMVFDILMSNGEDLRRLPWLDRRGKLSWLIKRNKSPFLQLSDAWEEGAPLLQIATEMHLEGIVSKLVTAPYRSGPTDAWQKVKVPGWEKFRPSSSSRSRAG